jgi:Arc-like DNA binding domain
MASGHKGGRMTRNFPSRKLDKFILRLPDGMRDVIAASAKANNRTMNAEIVLRLQNSFSSKRPVTRASSGNDADRDERLPEGLFELPEYLEDVAEQIRNQTGQSSEQRSSKVKRRS